MPAKVRMFDMVIGLSFLHSPLPNEDARCPWHSIVGLVFSGSPTHMTNSLPTAQNPGLIFYMGCPHPLCSLGLTLSGSSDTFTGGAGMGQYRVGDIGLQMGLEPCGMHIAVMGSPTAFANGG